jgi:hypothetical protein
MENGPRPRDRKPRVGVARGQFAVPDSFFEPLPPELIARFEGEVPLMERLPAFAVELEELLRDAGEMELASQVPQLWIVNRCRCGDDFCATFHVRYRFDQPAKRVQVNKTVALDALEGVVNVDVENGKIVTVEALYREDIRSAILTLFPA